MQMPLTMGWLGPVGLIWWLALQSSQLYAPQSPAVPARHDADVVGGKALA
jgi:hypothetical protein